jgi:nucleotide-binding universal stress UspA family protein
MEQPFHKILVPTDFSADAARAVRVASELSRRYLAPLTLIHIYDPVAYPWPDGYMMYTPGQLSQMWAEFERRLTQAQKDALDAGAVRPKTRLLQGLTATEIVRFARDEGDDLIVMGTHGRTGVGRVLFGSVAARVVQTAECPVLTVKRAELDTEKAPREPAAAARSA